jgi:anti-anti-sigma regulatory factor
VGVLVADFSSASFVDSSMLGVVIDTNEEARELGKTFRLQLGTADIVRRAFEICRVFAVVERVVTREAALAPKE